MRPTGATDPYPGRDGSSATSPRRAVEGATLVIIAATVVTVVASSWPIFITWLDYERPDTARPGIARVLRGRGWAVGTPRSGRSPQLLSPRSPHGGMPANPLLDPHRLALPPGAPENSVAGAVAKPLTIVQLLDRADPQGKPVVSVNPNETLIVVREVTPWILLAVKREGKVEFGWTTRSQVSISR